MKNIALITGGAGFIGSHLSKVLLEQGQEVICVDSLITGREENIEPFAKNPSFTFIKSDVRDNDIYTKLSSFDINQIYDLASPASVDFIMSHPIHAATTNSLGVHNLLELALKKRATFFFASSSEAYGDPHVHPQSEDYWGNVNPVGVRSGYDEGKRFGEALVSAYHREQNLEVRIARIFNTYGPNSSPTDGRVIPRFITSALAGAPIPLHGDGSQTRSFCYVSDLVDGFIALMASSVNSPVNIGNPVEMTISEVAKKIVSMTGSTSEITLAPRPADDPARRMPDITLAKTLGWKPVVSFDEGIKKTIEYFRSIAK